MDASEVRRAAQPAGELIDAPGLGEGERERPGEELVAPVDLPRRTVRQGLAHCRDEALAERVEMLRHHQRAEFRGIVHVGDQREVALPSCTAARRANTAANSSRLPPKW